MEREFSLAYLHVGRGGIVDESASCTYSTARLSSSISTAAMEGNSARFFWLEQAARNGVVVPRSMRTASRDALDLRDTFSRRNFRLAWQARMKNANVCLIIIKNVIFVFAQRVVLRNYTCSALWKANMIVIKVLSFLEKGLKG